jgi:PAS domain S-box-containing protein
MRSDGRHAGQAELRLFKRVVDASTDAIGVSTADGRHWHQNAAFDALFGDVGDDPPATLYCDEAVGREVFGVIEAGGEWRGEVQMWAADGRRLDILLRAYALLDEAGEVLGLVGVHTDITRQKRETERLELLARATNDVFYEWDPTTDSLHWLTDIGVVLGYGAGQVAPTIEAWIELLHPDDRGQLADAVERHRTVTSPIDYRYRVKASDGTWRYWQDLATPVLDEGGRPVWWVGGISDVTERMEVEEALRRSEERYRLLIEHQNDLVVEVDAEGRFLFVSRSYCEMFGKTAEELLGQRFMPLVHEQDRASTETEMEALRRHPHTAYMEQRAMTKGGWRWLAWSDRAIPGPDGAIQSIVGVGRDITEQKRTQEALGRETERLAVTLRSIGDAVITTDADGRVVLLNPVAEALTGWSEADAVGRPLTEVFHIEDERSGETLPSPARAALASGEAVGLPDRAILGTRTGERRRIADSSAPIRARDGVVIGVVLVFRDVTLEERMEKELLKVEKLKSLGVLAGGIAHDFNNFLAGIVGNLSIAKLDLADDSAALQALDDMEGAAMRARELTQQLLTFAKGGEPVRRTMRIGKLVEEAVQFAIRGSNVRCHFDLAGDLLPVAVDEGQLGQVLHNLTINADQAMPDGGALTVTARNVALAADNPFALKEGPHVELRLRDLGAGIPPEQVKQIFDPYFSTKEKGSGLGLAVAYNIVGRHDGRLSVESTPGEGSTFIVLLPASPPEAAPETATAREVVAGRGRVLIMDDEKYVRRMLVKMLRRIGYDVAEAEDGGAAVALYREGLEGGCPFDAVILDLTIPGGMGGKEAIVALRALDPDVRAIVSSGYSNDPVMSDCTRHGFRLAVTKPYRIQEMSEALDAIIQGS